MRIRYSAAMLVGLISLAVLLNATRTRSATLVQAAEPAAASAASSAYLPLVMNASSSSTTAVSMQNFAYHPGALTVPVGTVVTWTNDEAQSFILHTATSGVPGAPSGVFDSPFMSSGQSFEFTFTSAGTFSYYCRVHGAAMTGTVTVVP